MKKFCLLITLLACVVLVLSASAEGSGFVEEAVRVLASGEEDGTLPLRFYDEVPDVPYMGVRTYSLYMKQQPLSLQEKGDGVCALVNEAGVELLCDPQAGVITAPDWNAFLDVPYPLENTARRWKDTNTRFSRIVSVEYEGGAGPIAFDLGKYGIRMFSDADDVYLPLSTLTNLLAEVSTRHMLYNGENLYAQYAGLGGDAPEGFFDSKMLSARLEGEARPASVVKQSYADLCFCFDYFFGHPGRSLLDSDIASKGLDQAIADLGEAGQAIREGLNSTDLMEYLSAMSQLFMEDLYDGHTWFYGDVALMLAKPEFEEQLGKGQALRLLKSPMAMSQIANELIPVQRSELWGDEVYLESGSTAVIRLDGFMPDEAAWNSYYSGEGDFPQDCLGNVITGLKRASENPEIKNVIFDLSANSGGSSDVMMAILAVTTGQNQLPGINKVTGQKMLLTFETDANFDGVFDEKDREIRYDFNYGVLTTRHAFSCGNLFPIVLQEAGAVLMGEPTSGGSCCIQLDSDVEGFTYLMSSGSWALIDSKGNSVEDGCSIDLPIETTPTPLSDALSGLLSLDDPLPSFRAFFDLERLDGMMNQWFADESAAARAA